MAAGSSGSPVTLSFLARAAVVYAGPIPIARVAPIRKEGVRVRWSMGTAEIDRFHAAIRQPTHIDLWYRNRRLTYAVRRGKVTDACLEIQLPALAAQAIAWNALPPSTLLLGRHDARSPARTRPTPSRSHPGTDSSSAPS